MNEVLALVRSAVNSAYIDLFKVNLKGQAFSKYFASVPWLDTLFLLGLHIGSLSMVVAISLILFSLFMVSNCTIRRKQFLRQIANGSFKLLSFNNFFFAIIILSVVLLNRLKKLIFFCQIILGSSLNSQVAGMHCVTLQFSCHISMTLIMKSANPFITKFY